MNITTNGLDIRLPVGILFGIFGVTLTVFGLIPHPGLYTKSLGININLLWGLVMLAFGGSCYCWPQPDRWRTRTKRS